MKRKRWALKAAGPNGLWFSRRLFGSIWWTSNKPWRRVFRSRAAAVKALRKLQPRCEVDLVLVRFTVRIKPRLRSASLERLQQRLDRWEPIVRAAMSVHPLLPLPSEVAALINAVRALPEEELPGRVL